MRAGRFVQQPSGYRAFLPAPLPPDPPIQFDRELTRLLSDADRALGRLDGVASVLPNPNLFVAMYVRHEAVLSSQIEGTQSTLEDVLAFEAHVRDDNRPRDVEEVVNYVRALNHGLRRLPELPLSLRLLREIHEKLLVKVRGGNKTPGEFRRSQNWIGPAGSSLADATFVPPPVHEMHEALGHLETFLHDREALPVLVQAGLAHAQFETIHPFLDGNGRIGRLLITFLLCEREVLRRPLLYLSHYFKARRAEYYDRLTAIRTGDDWEGWLKFFLRGVQSVSVAATDTARAILDLREQLRSRLAASAGALRLLDHLFERPYVSVRMAEKHLRCAYVTAAHTIEELVGVGALRETTGQKRNRVFRFDPFIDIFQSQAISVNGQAMPQVVTKS